MRNLGKLLLLTMNFASNFFFTYVFIEMFTHGGYWLLYDYTLVLPCEVVIISTMTILNFIWLGKIMKRLKSKWDIEL